METPLSSARRVTRSQTKAATANTTSNNIPISKKCEETEKSMTNTMKATNNGKQQQQQESNNNHRSALVDITNDSPIVGLAKGSLDTPLSAMSKKRFTISSSGQAKYNKTPGSGEALLRGQVKTLLQKVEEEAQISKFISLEHKGPNFIHQQHLQGCFINNSPIGLLAPTPANTPHVLNLTSGGTEHGNHLASVTPSPVEDKFVISQMVNATEGNKQEDYESEKSIVTRTLFLDFSEKSEGSDVSDCSSVVIDQQGPHHGNSESSREKVSTDDDDASVWSIQVNASIRDEEEEDEQEGLEEVDEEECGGEYDYDYEDEEVEEYDDGGLLDELCEGISRMNVTAPQPSGTHTRFVYNSEDEIEGEETVMHLKGLPTPRGKHLRFPEGMDD